mmetsp:Transcript_3480/g.6539  ORF Transcript_3480/g.6539 Transcript_3480/m.6539 type:complete len:119 (+) Transcript_3480:1934-2290(+)
MEEFRARYEDCNRLVYEKSKRERELELKLVECEVKTKASKFSSTSPAAVKHSDVLIELYRTRLNCSIETDLQKEVMLQRCGHLFSQKAINDLIATRNRKCPICGEKFGYDDVKTVYFS